MQSRISWHICAVNMLPSSGRFSVSQPIGPSFLVQDGFECHDWKSLFKNGNGAGTSRPPAMRAF
jgi:hypothetical protein